MKKCMQSGIGIMALVLATLFSGWAMAGDLEPPTAAVDGSGDPVSTMVTLDEVYDKLEMMQDEIGTLGLGVGKTGQTTFFATGDDGDLQEGNAWPDPRFTENGDGTVTDNLTGLVWLKNANCFGTVTWATALSACNSLADGSCGLTDGSAAGDWRLPNRFELESLLHLGFYNPAIPNTSGIGQWSADDPFDSVLSGYYWSGSTYATSSSGAWYVSLSSGNVSTGSKASSYSVWPVRDGN